MAFTYAKTKDTVLGNMRMATGTYTSASASTGGSIVTGLSEISYFNTDCETSQAATVNLVATTNGTVVLTTVANEVGTWIAIGN